MRCAVYVRVSTDMDTQKTSIAHQISYFEKYIEEKNWTLYRVYQDIESGRNIKNREGIQKLLDHSKQNKFDMILTKSISRFARNTLEGLTIIRDLKSRDIRFVTIEDGFDSNEYDEFMFTLLLSIAQKESEKMSERIKFGKLSRAKMGGYNGSTPPYGYRMDDQKGIIPSEDGSTYVVQKIFTMYLQGMGLYKIAKELNEKGYPTPSQVAKKANSSMVWHQSTLRKILSNSFYVGDTIQNKTATKDVITGERKKNQRDAYVMVRDTHRGIIDRNTFQEVQRRLAIKGEKESGPQNNLFSNILVCGECGRGMHYKKQKKSYICGRVNKMGKGQCQGSYIKEETLKGIVRDELRKIISDRICKKSFLEEMKKERIQDDEKNKMKKIQASLREFSNKKNRLLGLLMEEWVDKESYRRKMKEIEVQEGLLERKKEKIIQESGKWEENLKIIIDKIFNVEEWDVMEVHKLITKIEVFRNNNVEIEYTFNV